ncbi:aldo/keto reductase [Natronosalvus halobius]|uniref:aldo/keto reductase n=1 Tax=Natronosalvus halobius TaxID=2953746 RepID=UPI0020A168DF|nr:aldo/keto reductase [Natronosalvus halobius]USZ72678.1 aldo/keto reductase [Natronosalvus halobius]
MDSSSEPTSGDCPAANGMPMLGLGTWQNTDPSQCADSVRTALEMGYRHVDTAQGYDNEEYVGQGIADATANADADADIDREDVFLATKVATSNLAHDDVLETTEESLAKLGVDAVDLLYVHWPINTYDAEETLAAFDELYDDGLIRNVGVSNFEPRHLQEAIDLLDAPLFANQVECHPLLPQEELRSVCADQDVELVAYSPLARGEVFDVPEIQSVAEKHDVSEAQVSLAWLREKGVTAIPKATGQDHISDNWASLGVELDSEDLERIDGIEEVHREVDPDMAPWN